MSGGNEDSVRNALIMELAKGVAALGEHDALTVAELATAGIVVWDVRRDRNGTPLCRYQPPVSWASLYDDGVLSDQQLRRDTQADSGSHVVFVCSSQDGPQAIQAFDRLHEDFPEIAAFRCTDPLDEVLRQVLANDPLTQWYELVVLRRTQSGRLLLAGHQLFPPSAQRGDQMSFTIRCGPSDGNGTVFAVVTAEPLRRFQLVSVESVKLPPGSYHITAKLRRPGLVRFEGLPASATLREDHRSWPNLVTSVPERLRRPRPAHLVCLVEVGGADDQVRERLDRIEQLIQRIAGAAEDSLSVSLISYGPHSFDHAIPDQPPRILTWAGSSDAALAAVGRLRGHGPAQKGYDRAAQLECALTEVANRLSGQEGRLVLVTVGARRAFPPRVDPASGIIPCPKKHDWRKMVQRLHDHPGMAFGAIRDHGADDEVWNQLGHDASARVSTVSVRRFAADLGLIGSTIQHIPFPLYEAEGH